MVGLIKNGVVIFSIIFGLDLGWSMLPKNIKIAIIKKIAQPQPPLAPFTRKMTGWELTKDDALQPQKKTPKKRGYAKR